MNPMKYTIEFECGHSVQWPESWEKRASAVKQDRRGNASSNEKYWRDQSRPVAVGAIAACPECKGRTHRLMISISILIGSQSLANQMDKPASPALYPWYEKNWRARETPDFVRWFHGIYDVPSDYVDHESDPSEYYIRRAFALMGWLGSIDRNPDHPRSIKDERSEKK